VVIDPQAGQPGLTLSRNDSIAVGESQLLCYQPLFGYRLEQFRVGILRPGPADSVIDGRFNFKDPACYVFPQANACRPGDELSETRRADLHALLGYRPYAFVEPLFAVLSNWISFAAVVMVLSAMLAASVCALRRRMGTPGKPSIRVLA